MPIFIHIPPTGSISSIEVNGTDDDAAAVIKKALDDGYLELISYTIHPDMAMMVDEDGQRKRLPFNGRATTLQNEMMFPNVIVGSAVLIGRQGPLLASCPLSLAEVEAVLSSGAV